MKLSKEQIKNHEFETIYRVVEFDEMYFEVVDTLGIFNNLKEAKKRCYHYWNEETDDEGFLEIWIYKLQLDGKYKRVEIIDRI